MPINVLPLQTFVKELSTSKQQ